ncbi:hypothetical protein GCM10009091_49080 [Pseudomonas brenneri]|jgi:hypothetical protein|uniref:Holin n=2 Tax=Pseudomonas TaxID=286 RepID=A0A5B2UK41_9PSED|nr:MULTISPECIES: holin [Pseudomonas fluorescens group]KAA6179161.1 holin [Pseudomonas marginalis]KAA2226750.1 holin [Pseudomonas brenneri]NVZ22651.1 holin [Pseudomonas costantinii]TWR74847.1 holin [Pseudomonas brenneri]SDU90721.1 Bacteriophage holin family, superfamily II-like [Pseudomonas brenneri]
MANPTPEGIVEAVIVPAANKGLLVGAATGVVGWLSQVNWIGLSGVGIAVLGLLINLYFQIRKDRREAEAIAATARREDAESAARIKALLDKCDI